MRILTVRVPASSVDVALHHRLSVLALGDAPRRQAFARDLARALTTGTPGCTGLVDVDGRIGPLGHPAITVDAPTASLVLDAGDLPAGPRTDTAALERYLLDRVGAPRPLLRSGSLPLIVDDALRQLADEPVAAGLTLLARLADQVQIVWLSDDPRVLRWAEAVEPDVAGLHVLNRPDVVDLTGT